MTYFKPAPELPAPPPLPARSLFGESRAGHPLLAQDGGGQNPLPLVAMAARQRPSPPTAPLETRSLFHHAPTPMPGPAVAAHLAHASMDFPMAETHPTPPPRAPTSPAPPEAWPVPGGSTADPLITLRTELNDEISQLRNDLFGAVMGVSALKDRIDNLEQHAQHPQPAPPPPMPAGPSRAEIEAWMRQWLEANLGLIVQDAVRKAAETLPTGGRGENAFYPVPSWFHRPAGVEPGAVFTQPPVILPSSRP